MKTNNFLVCLCIPLTGLFVLGAPFLIDAILAVLTAVARVILFVGTAIGPSFRYIALAVLAVLTLVVVGNAHASKPTLSGLLCGGVSAAVAVALFWNADLLVLLLLLFAAGVPLILMEENSGAEKVAVLALTFVACYAVNGVTAAMERKDLLWEDSLRAHEMTAEELADLDARLTDGYMGPEANDLAFREWAMTDALTAPAVVRPDRFRFGVADALVFVLPDGEDLIRCGKTPEGRVTVIHPQGASWATALFFNRLCALRSDEY